MDLDENLLLSGDGSWLCHCFTVAATDLSVMVISGRSQLLSVRQLQGVVLLVRYQHGLMGYVSG